MELYPFITTADWQNRDHCAHRVLVPHAHKVSPLLAFGILENGRPKYLSNKGMRKHRLRIENIELDALERVRFRKERAGWEPLLLPGGNETPEMYQKVGDCLTASEIADQRTMKDLQALMGLERIFVGIPTQETLIAGKDRGDVEKLAEKRFAAALEKGETPLVTHVYELRDGQITKLSGADSERAGSKTNTKNKKIVIPSSSASSRFNASTSRTRRSTSAATQSQMQAHKSTPSSTSSRIQRTPSGTHSRSQRTPTSTQSRGQKTITIAKPTAPPAKPFSGQATFISFPATASRPGTSAPGARQRELLKLPSRMWMPLLALHVFAAAYLAVSIYGLVELISGAMKEDTDMTVYVLLSFTAIPFLWVLAWANYMIIRFLKRGATKAYFFAWSLIGIWLVVPFLSLTKMGMYGLIPVLLGIALVIVGAVGLIHEETKTFCGVGEPVAE